MLDWPGKSPDLNLIENSWAKIKAKVFDKQHSRLEALQKVAKEVWVHENSPDYCLNLIKSKLRCLHQGIKNKGGCTKY